MRVGQDKGKQLAMSEDIHQSTIKLWKRWKVRMQGGDEAYGGSSKNILRQFSSESRTTPCSVSTRLYNRCDQNVELFVYTNSANKLPNYTNTRYIQFTSTLSVESFKVRDIGWT